LAGLWEFPCIELVDDFEACDTSVLDQQLCSMLKEITGHQLDMTQIHRIPLGPVMHLFTHIRKTYHVTWLRIHRSFFKPLDSEISTESTRPFRWIEATNLAHEAIPTAAKKAYRLLEKYCQKTTSTQPRRTKVS
jgi:A/G-specific adenine glycosylase